MGTIRRRATTPPKKLRDAYEATGKSPGWPATMTRVQSSPKPDHAVTIQMDRFGIAALMARLQWDGAIVWHCILQGRTADNRRHQPPQTLCARQCRRLAHVREALDRLAAAMGS